MQSSRFNDCFKKALVLEDPGSLPIEDQSFANLEVAAACQPCLMTFESLQTLPQKEVDTLAAEFVQTSLEETSGAADRTIKLVSVASACACASHCLRRDLYFVICIESFKDCRTCPVTPL